jgi:hypothetical protein
MDRLQRYWATIREQQKELDRQFPGGSLFITPVHDPSRNFFAGDVVEVDTMNAAKLIVEGRFKISLESEVVTHLRRCQERQAITDAQNLRINGMVKVLLSPARGPK